jgi:hypothetical protein
MTDPLTRELPAGWDGWTPEQRVDYLARYTKRRDLVRRIMARSLVDVPEPDTDQRITKEMLAAILLSMRSDRGPDYTRG